MNIQDVQESMNDIIQSIGHVHGEKFCEFVVILTTIAQIQERVSALYMAASDPEYSEQKQEFSDHMKDLIHVLLSSLASNISTSINISEEDVPKCLEWADKIMDMFSERINQGIQ